MTTADRDSHPRPAPDHLTLPALAERKQRGERIVMVTAYDAPSARLADQASIDIIFVGDSAANNMLGYDGTTPISMDEMVVLARAARRTTKRAFFLVDMPLGSFQVSDEEAVRNAGRLMKEGGATRSSSRAAAATPSWCARLVAAGIPVMGHIGLTPQCVHQLGGFKVQGRDDGRPPALSTTRTRSRMPAPRDRARGDPEPSRRGSPRRCSIPTIGIGAGVGLRRPGPGLATTCWA